jgi:hypothetical protein
VKQVARSGSEIGNALRLTGGCGDDRACYFRRSKKLIHIIALVTS